MKTWVAVVHREMDHRMRQVKGLSCRGAGCFGCCHGPVIAHEDEIEAILPLVTEAQLVLAAQAAAVQAAVLAQAVNVEKAGYLTNVTFPSEATVTRKQGVEALAYRCPLLDPASGACTVYAHRPLVCRGFGVSSPPANCAPGSKGKAVVPPEIEQIRDEVLGTVPSLRDRRRLVTLVDALVAEQQRRGGTA